MEKLPKFLIIGEAGERPWYDGPAAERLWGWFNVSGYEGLKSIAHLTNVYRSKGSRVDYPGHGRHVQSLLSGVKHVVLVGKVAQLKYGQRTAHDTLWWSDNRYMGLPHPSGLNRQLNELGDDVVRDYIDIVLHTWGYR
jgi:hypothetical protein